MTAQIFIYGKGRHFHYGTQAIAPMLRSAEGELCDLSTYANPGQGHSVRYGTLRSGVPYLSFAFSLPQGSAVDSRAQVRVITFVFPRSTDCPLTPALLRALPALTLEEVEELARSGNEVNVDDLIPPDPPPPVPVSHDLSIAILATLFSRQVKGGSPALLAQTSPEELLSALAALPVWLLREVTFNTDVQLVSEPIQLLNAWTPEAKAQADRSNYSGADRSLRRLFYPAEDGVRLYVGGLERVADRFLSLSPREQEDLAAACGYDLAQLVTRLEEPQAPQADQPIPHKLRRTKVRRPRVPAGLFRSLGVLILLLAGLLGLHIMPTWSSPFLSYLFLSVLSFLGGASLGWGALRLAEGPRRTIFGRWRRAIRTQGSPRTCRRLLAFCRKGLPLAGAGCFLLLVYGGAASIQVAAYAAETPPLLLRLFDPWQLPLSGSGLGILLWFRQVMTSLEGACRDRLHDLPPWEEQEASSW